MPKQYPAEVKDRAVRMVLDHQGDYPSLRAACVAIGERLGISRASLQRWVAQAQVDTGAKPGLSSAEAEEIKALKAENKRLREANEILRSASIFFARELDPRQH
ncbi:transposase [Kineococcus indalonis]|uniref:transposase n=1 Tax=Kineococcus indalonis TaxID=2696566 RepID=UPI001413054A|nr:transposase [Kineococcus indalonis]NAZ85193.1 transposase [Kineococcus indalonis]